MIDWKIEWPQIQTMAVLYGVDPFFIAAIRRAENGAPGIEYGDEAVKGTNYATQLAGACASLRNRLAVYEGNPLDVMACGRTGVRRTVYRREFIDWFAARWAPGGVANDPTNLNVNWAHNATIGYYAALAKGTPDDGPAV